MEDIDNMTNALLTYKIIRILQFISDGILEAVKDDNIVKENLQKYQQEEFLEQCIQRERHIYIIIRESKLCRIALEVDKYALLTLAWGMYSLEESQFS